MLPGTGLLLTAKTQLAQKSKAETLVQAVDQTCPVGQNPIAVLHIPPTSRVIPASSVSVSSAIKWGEFAFTVSDTCQIPSCIST